LPNLKQCAKVKREKIEFAVECRGIKVEDKENRKKLRGYLKSYRMWQAQARDIERSIANGEVPESLRTEFVKVKDDFVNKCRNVQIILGHTRSELERRILNMRYVSGKSMKQIAREVGYSNGYCGNVEINAINRLSADLEIMQLVR